MKNETSAPISSEILIKLFFDIFNLKISFIANKVTAAFELPPPKPEPIGIFYLKIHLHQKYHISQRVYYMP